MSSIIKVMAALARYTLPDDVDVSVDNMVREFCLSCVDTLRKADQEHRAAIARAEAAERERDQARAKIAHTAALMRADIEAIMIDEKLDADDVEDHEQCGILDHFACMLEAALKGPVTP